MKKSFIFIELSIVFLYIKKLNIISYRIFRFVSKKNALYFLHYVFCKKMIEN